MADRTSEPVVVSISFLNKLLNRQDEALARLERVERALGAKNFLPPSPAGKPAPKLATGG